MSLTQPQAPDPPSLQIRVQHWHKEEWQHFSELPEQRLLLLGLTSMFLFFIDPCLPIAAYRIIMGLAGSLPR